jgi:hypothetical protein
MARRIAAAIARALREQPRDQVHIHAGAHGRQYVCEDPNCTSPGIASYDA